MRRWGEAGVRVVSGGVRASVEGPDGAGIALLHSFGYEEARQQFTVLAKSDPKCAMAHWGVAMSGFHELWENPTRQRWIEAGRRFRRRRRRAKTDREQMYIAALNNSMIRQKDGLSGPRRRLYRGHAGGAQAYPEDVETSAFYALSLLADVAPDDTSLVKERKALAVLVPLFEKNPDHPGLAHYIIHTCDTPALAKQGCRLPKSTRRLLRRLRMRCICRDTSSRGWGCGRQALARTWLRWWRVRRLRQME